MPLRTQRRNTAYLNHRIPRFGKLDRDLDGRAPMPWTGLEIDLDGSVDRLFRPDELGASYLDGLFP